MKYFYPFILLALLFSSGISCGGGGSGSSADLNLSAQNCGNALVNENESCDDGNTNNSDGCNTHCAWEVGEAICGNGVLENEECCDDGNNVSGDGCSAACTSERNNRSPSAPILAAEPANGATWAPTRLYLSWNTATDPDAGDQVSYDVYFVDTNGISPNAVPYKKGITHTHFIIQASTDNRPEFFPDLVRPIYLESEQTYTWKVCARDKAGAQACSESRIFNTDNSVVGWWRFDEDLSQPSVCEGEASNSSRKVCDYSGNNNHGVANGSPAWLPSPSNLLGSAIQFDGVDDWVEIANSMNLNPTLQLAIEVRQTLQSLGVASNRPLVTKNVTPDGSDHTGYSLTFGFGGDFYFSIDDIATGRFVSTGIPAVVGLSKHLVGTYDGVNGKIFVNGVLSNTRAFVGNVGANNAPLRIGRNFGSGYFHGLLEDVLVYDRGLSSDEVQNAYLTGQ